VQSLTPHSFITTEGLQARLKRPNGAEDDIEQRLLDAVNNATHWLEMVTRRALKARNHRTAVTIVCSTVAVDDATLGGVGFTTSAEVGDDIVDPHATPGVAAGSQVLSITSGVLLEMTLPAIAVVESHSMSFGSRPLVFSGDGTNEAYLTQRPIVEVFSLYSVDTSGTQTALDMTGARYDYNAGRIVLGNDVFPKGVLNIVANVRAGYEQPTSGRVGHPEWYSLEQLAYRAAEVFFTDALHIRGRAEDVTVSSLSARVGVTPMPSDLIAGIQPFVRRW